MSQQVQDSITDIDVVLQNHKVMSEIITNEEIEDLQSHIEEIPDAAERARVYRMVMLFKYIRQEMNCIYAGEEMLVPPMHRTAFQMVCEWHRMFGVPVLDRPQIPPADRVKLKVDLIEEELREIRAAITDRDIVAIADGFADLEYVVCGAAAEFGIPHEAVFEEVHRSNMSKLWPDGKPRYREDGKVLKPESYSPANIGPILDRAIFAAELAESLKFLPAPPAPATLQDLKASLDRHNEKVGSDPEGAQ